MKRAICGLLAITGLAGCGFTSSPAQGLTFAAPRGWQASPGIMGFMQFWKPPSGPNEMLMLIKSPKPLRMSDVLLNRHMEIQEERVLERHAIRICGGRPADYVKAEGSQTSAAGGAQRSAEYIQLVGANVNGSAYFAIYVYPKNAIPDAQALAALRELCPVAAR
jgi:hypothetical protein